MLNKLQKTSNKRTNDPSLPLSLSIFFFFFKRFVFDLSNGKNFKIFSVSENFYKFFLFSLNFSDAKEKNGK